MKQRAEKSATWDSPPRSRKALRMLRATTDRQWQKQRFTHHLRASELIAAAATACQIDYGYCRQCEQWTCSTRCTEGREPARSSHFLNARLGTSASGLRLLAGSLRIIGCLP